MPSPNPVVQEAGTPAAAAAYLPFNGPGAPARSDEGLIALLFDANEELALAPRQDAHVDPRGGPAAKLRPARPPKGAGVSDEHRRVKRQSKALLLLLLLLLPPPPQRASQRRPRRPSSFLKAVRDVSLCEQTSRSRGDD
jgi:hypothetical protein